MKHISIFEEDRNLSPISSSRPTGTQRMVDPAARQAGPAEVKHQGHVSKKPFLFESALAAPIPCGVIESSLQREREWQPSEAPSRSCLRICCYNSALTGPSTIPVISPDQLIENPQPLLATREGFVVAPDINSPGSSLS